MKTSEKIDLICTAFAAAQGEMLDAKMTAENPFFKSKYATLKDIRDASKAALAKYKLCITQGVASESEEVHVTTILGHESGQYFETTLALKPEKLSPQSMGSAITYARRYALSAILGMASEEDDDANAAEKHYKSVMPTKKVEPLSPKKDAKTEATNGKKHLEDLTLEEIRQKVDDGIIAVFQYNKTRPDVNVDEERNAQVAYSRQIWDDKPKLIALIKAFAKKLKPEPEQQEL